MRLDQHRIYDVAIIGGGIAGAAIARDAALRGASVILFEKEAFGSGTSSKSSKLIHGGIRYLESSWKALKRGQLPLAWKNFRFVFVSLKECRILEDIAPNLIKPLPLLVPLYRSQSRHPWTVYLGVCLYYLLARFSGPQKRPRLLWNARSVKTLLPELKEEGLRGGVVIWDRITDDKLLVERTIQSARTLGCQALEHTRVTHYTYDHAQEVFVLTILDETGQSLTVRSRAVINAAGPWVDDVRKTCKDYDQAWLEPVAGCHVVFKKLLPISVILEAQDGRLFFGINTSDKTRIGTTETPYADPESVKATSEEVQYLMDSWKSYFPEMSLKEKEALGTDAGIRPLLKPEHGLKTNEISREHAILKGPSGALHVIGVKLTDHRRVAKEVVDKIMPDLLRFNPLLKKKCQTHQTPL